MTHIETCGLSEQQKTKHQKYFLIDTRYIVRDEDTLFSPLVALLWKGSQTPEKYKTSATDLTASSIILKLTKRVYKLPLTKSAIRKLGA